MRCLIVSLESFQKGIIPEEVKEYLASCRKEPFIILDESSKIKTNNPCKESKKSKRTQAIMQLNTTGERCILTGTFMSKSPCNAYDQMNFLKPSFFPESMYAFAERYEIRRSLPSVRGARVLLSEKDYEIIRKRLLSTKDKPWEYKGTVNKVCSFYGITEDSCDHILHNAEYTPFKHLDELWSRIGDTCVKVERRDILDLPEKVYRTINVSLTKEQTKLYLELQNLHCTDHITVDNGLKLYLRFQDVCNGYEPIEHVIGIDDDGNDMHEVELLPLKENPKVEALLEVAEELGDAQAVIWCSRTRLLHDCVEALKAEGYTVGIYDGKIGKEQREADYEAFNKGKLQFIVCNQASAGYGLDGLKEADYAVYISNSYSVEQRVQSEARTDRGKTEKTKYVFDIVCKGTCEERVTTALKNGKELLDTGKTDTSLFILKENA